MNQNIIETEVSEETPASTIGFKAVIVAGVVATIMATLYTTRRSIHTSIVKQYIPDDNQMELADALFNWKHSR